MATKKSKQSVEEFAFEAWKALHSYRSALCYEYFHNCDPLDTDFRSMRKAFYDRYDYVTDMMFRLNGTPNPFDNVLLSYNYQNQ